MIQGSEKNEFCFFSDSFCIIGEWSYNTKTLRVDGHCVFCDIKEARPQARKLAGEILLYCFAGKDIMGNRDIQIEDFVCFFREKEIVCKIIRDFVVFRFAK